MDVKKEIRKAMDYLENIDCLNLFQKTDNQKKINKAYFKLEAILKYLSKEGELWK